MDKIFAAPKPNKLVNTANQEGNIAGFWQGLWHGFVSPVTLVMSLFNENVGVYEAHNNGSWYNFGFLLGTMMIFGGGGGTRTYTQK
jgi:hypothetical protein